MYAVSAFGPDAGLAFQNVIAIRFGRTTDSGGLRTSAAEAKRLYGIDFVDISSIKNMDAVILAVAHTAFESFTTESMGALFGRGKKVLLDIKGLLSREEFEKAGYLYWRF